VILFRLCILNNNDQIAKIQGGGKLEKDLIELIASKVSEKTWRVTTRSRVKAAISEGLQEAINELKQATVQAL
jgi:hypothetical protein